MNEYKRNGQWDKFTDTNKLIWKNINWEFGNELTYSHALTNDIKPRYQIEANSGNKKIFV